MKFWLARRGPDARAPIHRMASVAAELGWQGPLTNPDLTPVIGYDPFQGPAYPEPDPATTVGSLMLQLHAIPRRHGQVRRVSYLAAQTVFSSADRIYPSLSRLPRPLLAQCFRGQTARWQTTVGNCQYWLTTTGASAVDRPLPGSLPVGSGFCVVHLKSPYPTTLQVVPSVSPTAHRYRHPRLDAQFLATGLPLPVSGQLADLIASRQDWAFAAHRHTLVCVTLDPIRSGAQAERLASSTTRAADFLDR